MPQQVEFCSFCFLRLGSQEKRVVVEENLYAHIHCWNQEVERQNFSVHPKYKEMRKNEARR